MEQSVRVVAASVADWSQASRESVKFIGWRYARLLGKSLWTRFRKPEKPSWKQRHDEGERFLRRKAKEWLMQAIIEQFVPAVKGWQGYAQGTWTVLWTSRVKMNKRYVLQALSVSA